MSWQLLGILSVFLFSITAIFQKINLRNKNHNPIAFSILFQISIGIFIGIYGFITHQIIFPNLLSLLFNLFLMIFFWTMDNIFYFKAMKNTDVSKVSILFSTRVLFAIAASSVFLHQSLNARQGIGTLLILCGVIIVNIKTKKIVFNRYDIYSVIAAAAIGFAITNDKYLLTYFNPYTYASLTFLAPGIFLWICYAKVTKDMKYYFKRSALVNMVLNIVIYAISAILFYTGFKLTPNVSVYASINVSTVVVIVLLSIIILKERENLWQVLSAGLLSFVGLLFVTS